MSTSKVVLCRHEQSLFNLVGMKVKVSAPPDNRSAMHSHEFQGTVRSINTDMNYVTVIDNENHYIKVDFDLIEKKG
jgi:ribosome maturation factor RimP